MLALSIVILFILSFQVMPVALGIDFRQKKPFVILTGILFLTLGQVLMFLIGIWLGDRFMHLVEKIQHIVLFVGFTLIAVRFVMEAFVVRKGERTYNIEKPLLFIFSSIAQSVNTFLAGILFFFIPGTLLKDIIYLAFFSFALTFLFVFIKAEKRAFSAISLLYLAGGVFLGILSFYFLFL
ncbi:MAG: manganese efflux pump [Bacteroidales bacterium]|nr:manganese efflux pump [Bacteroidales bacterium]